MHCIIFLNNFICTRYGFQIDSNLESALAIERFPCPRSLYTSRTNVESNTQALLVTDSSDANDFLLNSMPQNFLNLYLRSNGLSSSFIRRALSTSLFCVVDMCSVCVCVCIMTLCCS